MTSEETDRCPESLRARDSIWSFPYIALMMANLFQSMAAFMSNTILPVYADALGASTAMVGIVVSSYTVAAILIRPFAGPAFDSFSRKRLLIISQIIICVCMFSYGVAGSLEVIIVIRLIHGVGIGCSGPLAMSLVSEFLPKSKFASGISIYALAQSLAQVVGPAAGLYLMDALGFSGSYFIASACLVVAMTGVLFIKEPVRERLPYQLKLSRMFAPEAIGKGIALMFLATSFSCLGAYVVLYGYSRGVGDMGVFFIVYALCLVVTRPVYGKLADRFGTPRVLIGGIICFAASFVALSLAQNMMGFVIAAVISSAGFGCCGPLLQSAALASVPESRRGAASNTTFTGLDVGMLVGPVIAGVFVEGLTPIVGGIAQAYAEMWVFMLIPSAIAFLIVLRWTKTARQG